MTSDFLNCKWICAIIFIHASTLNKHWLFHVICHTDNSIFVRQFDTLTKFYDTQIYHSFIYTGHDSLWLLKSRFHNGISLNDKFPSLGDVKWHM